MLFTQLLIEKEVENHPRTKRILAGLKLPATTPIHYIDRADRYFGNYKKPYLKKRTDLNLIIGKKRGTLVKKAPDAYGLNTEAGEKGEERERNPHYYFIHTYNCIYECEYCYLQGYFNSPDIVAFINHEDIAEEMEKIILGHTTGASSSPPPPSSSIWFHAGEFSDSLALAHMVDDWDFYWKLFARPPFREHAILELRTKSVNIKPLLSLSPLPNVVVTFSLTPEEISRKVDRKTPPTSVRLKAMQKLAQMGHTIGIHLDPIIHVENFEEQYSTLIQQIFQHISWEQIKYISLGVVRFTQDVFHQVQKNYPNSLLFERKYAPGFDQKMRYLRPLRAHLLKQVEGLIMAEAVKKLSGQDLSSKISAQHLASKIYRCME